MGYDDPASIQQQEARQELRGRRGGRSTGVEVTNVILVAVAIVLAAIAFEEIDHWSQWVVLGGIVAAVIGFMIAVSPARE